MLGSNVVHAFFDFYPEHNKSNRVRVLKRAWAYNNPK
jgi:hypothetical protein